MIIRALVLTACLGSFAAYLDRTSHSEPSVSTTTLSELPLEIRGWTGREGPAFAAPVVSVLGVDEYVNRQYYLTAGQGAAALYVGYYRSQRQGDSIHSPMNCLPGAGWQPTSTQRLSIPTGRGDPVDANRVIVEKTGQRQLVLYWYQTRGRTVASEYWSKVFLVLDAIRLNRTDGALVRVTTPIVASEKDAEGQAVGFVQALWPHLLEHLPG